MAKTGLYGYVFYFSVEYDSTDVAEFQVIINIYWLRAKQKIFGFIKKMFIGLLSFRNSLATQCVSLNNEPCIVRSALTDLNPVELN